MMALLNRLLGRRHVEAPRAGQIWRSEHSGRAILVSDVRTTDWGDVVVTVRHEIDSLHKFNPVPMSYARDLGEWHRRIHGEARFLELTLNMFPPHPLPAAGLRY
jgi:hypothetical protein